jgi:mono/diheme cytochrome c family protein
MQNLNLRLARWFLLAASGLGLAIFVAACSEPAPPLPPPPAAPVADLSPAHGKYLVETHVCHDCHTPLKMGPKGPEPDMARMLSGHPAEMKMPAPPAGISPAGPWAWAGAASNTAFAGPWGISYAANLTPDQNSGIGIWTEQMFLTALRTGKHMGTASSRDIVPPMPWQWFGKMTDDELKAIFAYLRTIPPVNNHVPDPAAPGAKG